jgi:hypothetical protein
MHAYISMIAMIELVCLYLCIRSCLDCEDELSYDRDCCESAGCFQGKWHTFFHLFYYMH